MNEKNFVAYYRVSTAEQGKSGLGLAAQKQSVLQYVHLNGTLAGEFVDIESGTNDDRAGLLQAIDACVRHKAILVVKELSRITRNGYRILALLDEKGITYIEANSPYDTSFLKDLKILLAKEERTKIVERTTAALAQIKANIARDGFHISKSGNKITSLGKNNLTTEAIAKASESRRKSAENNGNNLRSINYIYGLRNTGMTFYAIADRLNSEGFRTAKEKTFTQTQVFRLYQRAAKRYAEQK